MSLTVEDVPPLRGGRTPPDARPIQRPPRTPTRISRREFAARAVAMGASVAIVTLGALPPARRSLASHGGTEYYKIKSLPCPVGHGGDECFPGCGPSEVFTSSCVTSGHYEGWHKDLCQWSLRKDQCATDPGGGDAFDGWKWDYSGLCACCTYLVYRCHDGYNRDASCNIQSTSVCRWTLTCNPHPGC